MKELKLYQCEYCHTQYSDEIKCRACEDCHSKKAKIKTMKFLANDKYPVSINVEIENGKVITYKR